MVSLNNESGEPDEQASEMTPSSSDTKTQSLEDNQEFILIHDSGFNVKINAPGLDSFEVQVNSAELVQEIHQVLMDREETLHRTCFSLHFNDVMLDNFAELKSISGLAEGSVIDVVEEQYTMRQVRLHVRHVRDLLKSRDLSDLYINSDGFSPSYLNTITGGDILTKKTTKSDSVDCTPPDYVLPNCQERPLHPLHPDVQVTKKITCLKVLTYAGWNPPPAYRRLHGDLLYLYVETLEDKSFYITASNHGFYVNQCKDRCYDPTPLSPKHATHSLVTLLNQISPLFKKNFSQLLKERKDKHIFERLPSAYQLYSWMSPVAAHDIDFIRADDGMTIRLGYEDYMPGQMRDWNEESQASRELSKTTLPDRLIRERAIFKVHSDFVMAATKGAMAVVDGHVMAINPGEDFKMQMFIWNNIFFSLGFDVRGHYQDFGGDAAAYAAPANDLHGIKAYFGVDPDKLYTLGTVIVDYRGYRVTGQCIIPGILDREQEQSVVYGSIDFGKTIVSSDQYCKLLSPVANQLRIHPHRVLNDKEEKVELCSSVECKGIIGNDQRCYILDLLRTFPPDVNYITESKDDLSEEMRLKNFPRPHCHRFATLRPELVEIFVESKSLSFVKHIYLQQHLSLKNSLDNSSANHEVDEKNCQSLDDDDEGVCVSSKENPHQTNHVLNGYVHDASHANVSINEVGSDPLDNNNDKDVKEKTLVSSDMSHSMTSILLNDSPAMKNILMRPRTQPNVETKDLGKGIDMSAFGSLSDTEFSLSFNVDLYQPHVKHADVDSDVHRRERKLVVEAAEYLVSHQIPSFINECLEHDLVPVDGQTLCEALHSRGINLRYLGDVVNSLSQYPHLSFVYNIGIIEIICRSAKHLYKTYIQNVDMSDTAAAISRFLNCLLAFSSAVSSPVLNDDSRLKKRLKRKNRSPHQQTYKWKSETPKALWSKITEEAENYYHFILDCDSIDSAISVYNIPKVCLLRAFCITAGIQILLRDYQLYSKHKAPFTEHDIMNVTPKVKHINPKATDAYNFFASGQSKIHQGHLKEGYELISEAVNLLNNVYGALHPDISIYMRLLARLNYIMSDISEALAQQQRAVIMSERVFGIDHPSTITEYAQLALYCFANKQISCALHLLYRARYLATLCHQEEHPDIAIYDSNIGLILLAVEEFDLSLKFLENALALNQKFYGEDSLKVALNHHLVAKTHSCRGNFRAALASEKEAYSIYKQKLGENHERTKESSLCLGHITKQAVLFQRRLNEISKGEKVTSLAPIFLLSPSLDGVLDSLNAINGIVFIQINHEEISRMKKQLRDGNLLGVLPSSDSVSKVDEVKGEPNNVSNDTLKSADIL